MSTPRLTDRGRRPYQPLWVALIDLSRRATAESMAEMRKDGLAFHRTNRGEQILAVSTDNPWLARKWNMSALADYDDLKLARCDIAPEQTFLDRLGTIGGLNLIFVVLIAVLFVAWLLRQ